MKTALTPSTLAAKINVHHRQCVEAAGQALEHAKHAGELLALAKTKVAHGDWLPCLQANVPFSEKTVPIFRSVARGEVRVGWQQQAGRRTRLTAGNNLSFGRRRRPDAICYRICIN
jgi:hypothetical protein